MDFSPRERYIQYLNAQGMRLTRERAAVVDAVSKAGGPFAAEDLVASLGNPSVTSRVSRSTIYRTILEMERAKVISHDLGPSDVVFYRWTD